MGQEGVVGGFSYSTYHGQTFLGLLPKAGSVDFKHSNCGLVEVDDHNYGIQTGRNRFVLVVHGGGKLAEASIVGLFPPDIPEIS
jgi:hypothetical protein